MGCLRWMERDGSFQWLFSMALFNAGSLRPFCVPPPHVVSLLCSVPRVCNQQYVCDGIEHVRERGCGGARECRPDRVGGEEEERGEVILEGEIEEKERREGGRKGGMEDGKENFRQEMIK